MKRLVAKRLGEDDAKGEWVKKRTNSQQRMRRRAHLPGLGSEAQARGAEKARRQVNRQRSTLVVDNLAAQLAQPLPQCKAWVPHEDPDRTRTSELQ